MSADWSKHRAGTYREATMRLLVAEFGHAGYGLWFMVKDALMQQDGYRYRRRFLPALAQDLGCSLDVLQALVAFCLDPEIGLLTQDDTHVWCPDLCSELQPLDMKRERDAERKRQEREEQRLREESERTAQGQPKDAEVTTTPDPAPSAPCPTDIQGTEEGRPQDASLLLSNSRSLDPQESGRPPGLLAKLDTPQVREGLRRWGEHLQTLRKPFGQMQLEGLCTRYAGRGPEELANALFWSVENAYRMVCDPPAKWNDERLVKAKQRDAERPQPKLFVAAPQLPPATPEERAKIRAIIAQTFPNLKPLRKETDGASNGSDQGAHEGAARKTEHQTRTPRPDDAYGQEPRAKGGGAP